MTNNISQNELSFSDILFIIVLTITILLSCYFIIKRFIKDSVMISNLTSNIRIVPAVLINESETINATVLVEPPVPELPR